MIYYILIAIAAISLASCKKELEINYCPTDKFYVVTGYTNDTITSVRITQTTDMYNPIDTSIFARLTDATVTLRKSSGKEYDLTPNEFNDFVSTELLAKEISEQFDITVKIGKELFTTSAKLMPPVKIDTIIYQSQALVAPIKLHFIQVLTTKESKTKSYYRYIVRHNGHRILSSLCNIVSPFPTINQSFILGTSGEDGKIIIDTKTKRELHDGDEIEVEVQHLDAHTYNYLYALDIIGQTSNNPPAHFDGGCLGYYHAYVPNRKSIIYRKPK